MLEGEKTDFRKQINKKFSSNHSSDSVLVLYRNETSHVEDPSL